MTTKTKTIEKAQAIPLTKEELKAIEKAKIKEELEREKKEAAKKLAEKEEKQKRIVEETKALSARFLYLANKDKEVKEKEGKNSYLLLNELKDFLVIKNYQEKNFTGISLFRLDISVYKRLSNLLTTWYQQGLLSVLKTECINNFISIQYSVNDTYLTNQSRVYYNNTYNIALPLISDYGDEKTQLHEATQSALSFLLNTEL